MVTEHTNWIPPKTIWIDDGTPNGAMIAVKWAKLIDFTDDRGMPMSVYVPILPWANISKAQFPVIWANMALVNENTGELIGIGASAVIDEELDREGNIVNQTRLDEILNSAGWDYKSITAGAVYETAREHLQLQGIEVYTLDRPEVENWLIKTMEMLFSEGRTLTIKDFNNLTRVVPDLKKYQTGGEAPGFLSAFDTDAEARARRLRGEEAGAEEQLGGIGPKTYWGGRTQQEMLQQYQPYEGNVLTADEVRAGRKPGPKDVIIASSSQEAEALGAYNWIPSTEYDPELAEKLKQQQEENLRKGYLTHPDTLQTGRFLAMQQIQATPGGQKYPLAGGLGGIATNLGQQYWGSIEKAEQAKQKPLEDWEREWQRLVKQAKTPAPSRRTRL